MTLQINKKIWSWKWWWWWWWWPLTFLVSFGITSGSKNKTVDCPVPRSSAKTGAAKLRKKCSKPRSWVSVRIAPFLIQKFSKPLKVSKEFSEYPTIYVEISLFCGICLVKLGYSPLFDLRWNFIFIPQMFVWDWFDQIGRIVRNKKMYWKSCRFFQSIQTRPAWKCR